jgi:hypothetical protein
MARVRQAKVNIDAGVDIRDILFSNESDPYIADRREIVDIYVLQDTSLDLRVSVFAGTVQFADRITPNDADRFPITTQDVPITIGLNRGERLKLGVLNTDGANAADLYYLIVSRPA